MLALNSPSVSPTMLITIPFGQAKKTASAALVLIKKSELSTLAATIGPCNVQARKGLRVNLIMEEENTSLCSFLMGVKDAMPSPHPLNSEFTSPITNASAPATSNGVGCSEGQLDSWGKGIAPFP